MPLLESRLTETSSTVEDEPSNTIPFGEIWPIGVEGKPQTTELHNPYYDFRFDKLLVSLNFLSAIYEIATSEEDITETGNENNKKSKFNQIIISRRFFLQLTFVLASLGSIALSYKKFKYLAQLFNKKPYLVASNPEAIVKIWNDKNKALTAYKERQEAPHPISVNPIVDKSTQRGELQIFQMTTKGYEPGELALYIPKGKFSPVSSPNSIAARNEVFHEKYQSEVVAHFRAAAPGAIAFGKKLTLTESSQLTPEEQSIIYGSSSLFVDKQTATPPVWKHAWDRLTKPNSQFEELTFRNDPSQKGVVFLDDGQVKLISGNELVAIVQNQQLPEGVSAIALQQFAFSLSEISKLPENFKWSDDRHRNLSVFLQATDGTQAILSGSPFFLLQNSDYVEVIKQVGHHWDKDIDIVVCLDVGLAGPFSFNFNDQLNNQFYRPAALDWHNSDGTIDLGFAHTASGCLVVQ